MRPELFHSRGPKLAWEFHGCGPPWCLAIPAGQAYNMPLHLFKVVLPTVLLGQCLVSALPLSAELYDPSNGCYPFQVSQAPGMTHWEE